jgi:hypothetical protein
MWKLTITQKRKSEFSDCKLEHEVVFYSDSIYELGITAGRLSEHEEVDETVYKIEKVGEKND